MDAAHHTMQDLFAQLGLPDSPQDIRDFVALHRPLDLAIRLKDAPFWTASQAALIQEKLSEDSDWALLIDGLNAQLREHPASADLPQAVDADPAMQGEGNVSAARRYDAAAQAFVASGQVTAAARAAAPQSPDEAAALARAEADGLAKAKA